MNISIFGSGYVGLCTGAILASVGHKVKCIDIDANKVDIINSGKSHFFEVGLDEFVASGVKSGDLVATLDYKNAIQTAEIIFSCVGTPDLPDGSPNLTYIEDVVRKVAEECEKSGKKEIIFAQKSTVPVGTGDKLIKLAEKINPKLNLIYISNPEFLREGSAIFDTLNVDRLVVGGDDKEALEKLIRLFEEVDDFAKSTESDATYAEVYAKRFKVTKPFRERVYIMDIKSAELVKVTSNAFLALKISFANSIAKLADAAGADINRVMDGVGSDFRIGRAFLYPGLGWGGGCFPKDVSGLIKVAENYGVKMPIMDAATEVNASMIDFVVNKCRKYANTISGKGLTDVKVAVLGLSFKAGTSDTRKSQAIKLANRLVENGAKVTAYDPQAMEEAKCSLNERIVLKDSVEEAIAEAEIIVVASEWSEFINYDWSKVDKSKIIIDSRNCLKKEEIKRLGFKYEGVGVR